MENSYRIILDTNIIVSAACFGRGVPYEVLNMVGRHILARSVGMLRWASTLIFY